MPAYPISGVPQSSEDLIQNGLALQGSGGHTVPGHRAGVPLGMGQDTYVPPLIDLKPFLESFFKFFIVYICKLG
ncbi:hypothetical protein CEY12_15440 [Chryseobacterium sp. T16E-39]|nr:hypothetical protein [Chryseobacterium sp. T16E-39]ASK31416.1 hypothetical protein CEY12_15440 [Chryseobacterium sp. T16E-39]